MQDDLVHAIFDYCQEVLSQHYGPRIQWGEKDPKTEEYPLLLDGYSLRVYRAQPIFSGSFTGEWTVSGEHLDFEHPTQLISAVEEALFHKQTLESCRLKLTEHFGDRIRWDKWNQFCLDGSRPGMIYFHSVLDEYCELDWPRSYRKVWWNTDKDSLRRHLALEGDTQIICFPPDQLIKVIETYAQFASLERRSCS